MPPTVRAATMLEEAPFEGATHFGSCGVPGDGPYALVWMAVKDGRIGQIAYQTNGCRSSVACGEAVAVLLTGRTLEQAARLEPLDLALFLGGLPEGKEGAAERTLEALERCISQ